MRESSRSEIIDRIGRPRLQRTKNVELCHSDIGIRLDVPAGCSQFTRDRADGIHYDRLFGPAVICRAARDSSWFSGHRYGDLQTPRSVKKSTVLYISYLPSTIIKGPRGNARPAYTLSEFGTGKTVPFAGHRWIPGRIRAAMTPRLINRLRECAEWRARSNGIGLRSRQSTARNPCRRGSAERQ